MGRDGERRIGTISIEEDRSGGKEQWMMFQQIRQVEDTVGIR